MICDSTFDYRVQLHAGFTFDDAAGTMRDLLSGVLVGSKALKPEGTHVRLEAV
jgi:hypothetical protein